MSFKDLDKQADELYESFLNGNITDVMNELERLPRFESMLMVLKLDKRFSRTSKLSFERAISVRC